jgi:hypothetical protein
MRILLAEKQANLCAERRTVMQLEQMHNAHHIDKYGTKNKYKQEKITKYINKLGLSCAKLSRSWG